MKTLFFNLLALVLISSSFLSCEKDKPEEDNPVLAESFFTTMLNDEVYQAEDLLAYAYDLDEHITINGLGSLEGDQTVLLALPKGFTQGTYTMDDNTYAIVVNGDDTYLTRWEGGSGQIVVAKNDGINIQGTFHFTAINPDDESRKMVATEGEFDVKMRN